MEKEGLEPLAKENMNIAILKVNGDVDKRFLEQFKTIGLPIKTYPTIIEKKEGGTTVSIPVVGFRTLDDQNGRDNQGRPVITEGLRTLFGAKKEVQITE